jgi:ribulose 1,5-bisphosphate carboxylase large subunit-like protein
MVAVSTVTLLSGFATTEAAKQVAGDKATKTWITGTNPRPDHAAMSGETVLLSENFSNGAAWPGDGGALGAEDLANCNCELQIDVP